MLTAVSLNESHSVTFSTASTSYARMLCAMQTIRQDTLDFRILQEQERVRSGCVRTGRSWSNGPESGRLVSSMKTKFRAK